MEIKKEEAKKIYDIQPSWMKEKLEKAFGAETFRKVDFKDLNSFDDTCKVCGITEKEFEAKYKDFPLRPQTVSLERLAIVSEGINQGWEADPLDTTQKKWFPIFTVSSSGLSFTDSGYLCDYADAYVGSCLCYESEEKSNHSGKQFIKLWEEFILGKKLKS